MESKLGFHNTDQNCWSNLWSHHLQQDIIDLILERLGSLDRIRFGAVCTSWRAAVARSMATSALAFPFILHAACRLPHERHSLSSLDGNRVCYLNLYYTNGRRFLDIIDGNWLIMGQTYDMDDILDISCEGELKLMTLYFILNPMTGKLFILPKQFAVDPSSDNASCFGSVRISSEPTTSNCLVAGLSASGFSVYFCRLTDSEWTLLNLEDEFKDFEMQDIMFCREKLYVLMRNTDDFIIAFDLRHDNKNENGLSKAHKIVMTSAPIPIRSREVRHLEEGLVSRYSFYASYVSLATDSVSGELLVIVCDAELLSKKYPPDCLSWSFYEENLEKVKVISLSVYRLYMTNDQGQWLKVTDLGDRMLFYGNYCSFFIPTKALEESTHQGNCIYYAFRLNDDCGDVGKFCLNDQTIIPCPMKGKNACGWLAPQFRKCEF